MRCISAWRPIFVLYTNKYDREFFVFAELIREKENIALSENTMRNIFKASGIIYPMAIFTVCQIIRPPDTYA
jgi:hypothetical protein